MVLWPKNNPSSWLAPIYSKHGAGRCLYISQQEATLSTSSTSVNIYVKRRYKTNCPWYIFMIFYLHYIWNCLLRQAKKIMHLGNPIPDLPSWITTLPGKNPQFCVFIQTYFHVTPSKREQMLNKYVPVEKRETHNFYGCHMEGSKACCLYIIQIYMNSLCIYIYEFDIYIVYPLKSPATLRAVSFGEVPHRGTALWCRSERWRDLGKSSYFSQWRGHFIWTFWDPPTKNSDLVTSKMTLICTVSKGN